MNQYFDILRCGTPEDLRSRAAYLDSHLDIDSNLKKFPLDHYVFSNAIVKCVWAVALTHFGFLSGHTAEYWCSRGVDLGIIFFQQPRDHILKKSKILRWYQCFSALYLLSCFSPQGVVARRLASQFLKNDLRVEVAAVPIEPALGKIALLMASEYNSEISQQVELKNAKLRWKNHSKTLLDAWNALKADNQPQFIESLKEAVKEHASKVTSDDNLPFFAIATIESAMLGRAYEKGWKDLKSPPEIAARLVTHQSLGLA